MKKTTDTIKAVAEIEVKVEMVEMDEKTEKEQIAEDYARRKEEMFDGKRRNRENMERRAAQLDAYITLSFSSYECYAEFCRLMGVDEGSKFAKGEVALTMIEKSNNQ